MNMVDEFYARLSNPEIDRLCLEFLDEIRTGKLSKDEIPLLNKFYISEFEELFYDPLYNYEHSKDRLYWDIPSTIEKNQAWINSCRQDSEIDEFTKQVITDSINDSEYLVKLYKGKKNMLESMYYDSKGKYQNYID